MRESAGILLYRLGDELEVLLAHPGGPFWASREAGAWTVPKGEIEPGEDPWVAATREFAEELSVPIPAGQAIPLDKVRQKSGKWVYAWAIEGDIDPDSIVSNTVEIVWPPRSGRRIQVPEIDRVSWCSLEVARERLNPAQVPFLDRLVDSLAT
ncbi:MAG: NUDIX domain-containing protein [Acidimicrobiia bacterium]|nr:NUDIX domain-containing protein [Acidimicrobiia bacterium]